MNLTKNKLKQIFRKQAKPYWRMQVSYFGSNLIAVNQHEADMQKSWKMLHKVIENMDLKCFALFLFETPLQKEYKNFIPVNIVKPICEI